MRTPEGSAYLNDEVEDVPETSDPHLVAPELGHQDVHLLRHRLVIGRIVTRDGHHLQGMISRELARQSYQKPFDLFLNGIVLEGLDQLRS